MKKFLIILLAVITVLGCLPVAAFAAGIEKGDIDGNRAVTVEDARWALRGAIGLSKLTEKQLEAADMDDNKELTVEDARLILRKAIGLDKAEQEQHDRELTPEQKFEEVLYEHSHALLGSSKNYVTNDFTGIMKNFQKWCCYYTIGDVLRPVLAKLGYSQEAIDKLAPNKYPAEIWAKLLKQHGVPLPSVYGEIAADLSDIYSPSVVMAYYQQLEKEGLAKVYNLVTYYDNDITGEIVPADKQDIALYEPMVGDIIYITNKNKGETTPDGETYNYLIHTAQITKVNPDGTFMCTEGSIVEPSEGDGVARVREREYFWSDNVHTIYDGYGKVLTEAAMKKENTPDRHYSTYIFRYNSTVVVLAAIRPDWSYGAPETK